VRVSQKRKTPDTQVAASSPAKRSTPVPLRPLCPVLPGRAEMLRALQRACADPAVPRVDLSAFQGHERLSSTQIKARTAGLLA
jgi:hypothetical protein